MLKFRGAPIGLRSSGRGQWPKGWQTRGVLKEAACRKRAKRAQANWGTQRLQNPGLPCVGQPRPPPRHRTAPPLTAPTGLSLSLPPPQQPHSATTPPFQAVPASRACGFPPPHPPTPAPARQREGYSVTAPPPCSASTPSPKTALLRTSWSGSRAAPSSIGIRRGTNAPEAPPRPCTASATVPTAKDLSEGEELGFCRAAREAARGSGWVCGREGATRPDTPNHPPGMRRRAPSRLGRVPS